MKKTSLHSRKHQYQESVSFRQAVDRQGASPGDHQPRVPGVDSGHTGGRCPLGSIGTASAVSHDRAANQGRWPCRPDR